jgi:hypothetical protein
MVTLCQEKFDATVAKLRELEELQNARRKLAAETADIVKRNLGPCSKRLAAALHQLDVDVQAYHSCTFVGNHMHKLLSGDGPALLASALGNDPIHEEDKQSYVKLFTCLGRIQDFFFARFLTDENLVELEESCYQFARILIEFFPEQSVTPKMHFLVTHLPNFAKQHRTLGLMSEQSLEALHCRVNGIERQFAAIRDDERRLKMIMQHLYVSSSVLTT